MPLMLFMMRYFFFFFFMPLPLLLRCRYITPLDADCRFYTLICLRYAAALLLILP